MIQNLFIGRYRYADIKVLIFLLLLFPILSQAEIVFTSKRVDGETRQLFVMEDDGSNVRRITDSTFYDRNPSWFPDGKQILFERDLTRGDPLLHNANSEFYILDVKSGKEEKFMENHPTDREPMVSPDGKHIAFNSVRGEEWHIYVFTLESGTLKQLTNDGDVAASFGMAWSPDSKQLAYEREGPHGNTIWIMNADGTKKKRVSSPRPGTFFLSTPSWSPSGKYIMYRETERTPNLQDRVATRLMILNLRTGHLEVHEFPKETLIASRSCWMGDDRTVLLSLEEDWTDETAYYDIYRYDLKSRQLTNLTKHVAGDFDPHWIRGPLAVSPAGKQPVQWGQLKVFLKGSHILVSRIFLQWTRFNMCPLKINIQ